MSTEDEPTAAPGRRTRSTIRFPYGDLEDAISVATTIAHAHGTGCAVDQLAADLNQTVTSGAFRVKVATAQTFGVVKGSRGHLSLTDLGRDITDPQKEARAKVTAFLTVPLYEALYNRFLGHRLPGDKGLEQEIVNLGVSPKQADKARHALQRSARQAGFSSNGGDRLVKPDANTIDEVPPPPPPDHGEVNPTLALRPDLAAEPLLVGLFNKLPNLANEAEPVAIDSWLEALKVVLPIVYKPSRVIPNEPLRHSGQFRNAAPESAS